MTHISSAFSTLLQGDWKTIASVVLQNSVIVLKWRDIRRKTTKNSQVSTRVFHTRHFLFWTVKLDRHSHWDHMVPILMFPFINPMTPFFPQFLFPFDTLYQLYAHVLQSSMSGTVEMAINQLVFFLLAPGQTLIMGIGPALVVVESGSKFSFIK